MKYLRSYQNDLRLHQIDDWIEIKMEMNYENIICRKFAKNKLKNTFI